MNFFQKKPTRFSVSIYNYLFILYLATSIANVSAQQKTNCIDINLTDTLKYTGFNTNQVYAKKYPPQNLFDAKLETCWVAGSDQEEIPYLYVELPSVGNQQLNIFSGYGKSKKLYTENARPKTVRLSLYFAINPEGYVSEYQSMYKVLAYKYKQVVQLKDTFALQSILLDFPESDLASFAKNAKKHFVSIFDLPIAKTTFVLKLEILETYPGTKYHDVCISELFFNNALMSFLPPGNTSVEKAYLNADENTLLIDTSEKKEIIAFYDPDALLQIIEISEDKKWAILLSMPSTIEGRAETVYLLIDLPGRKMMNPQLEKLTGHFITGNAMYFETGRNGQLYLVYDCPEGNTAKIMLR